MGTDQQSPLPGQGDLPPVPERPGVGSPDCAGLFAWIWEDLSAVVGTPTAAALLRRALVMAAESYPDLSRVAITRERLTYSYRLPLDLSGSGSGECVPAFEALLAAVLRLAGELTGGMLVRRLVRGKGLRGWRLPETEEVRRWTSAAR